MVYAIEEINKNPYLLPNITLGFHIYDSCYTEARGFAGALNMLSGNKALIPNYQCSLKKHFAGMIGDSSVTSPTIARILTVYRYPQDECSFYLCFYYNLNLQEFTFGTSFFTAFNLGSCQWFITASHNTEEPAASHNTEEPAASYNTLEPAASYNTEEPAASHNTEEPAASYNTEEPAASHNTEEPAASHNTEEPAASHNTEKPAASYNTEEPAASHNTEEPAASHNTEEPAASYNTEEPAASHNTEEPAASHNTEEPAASYNTEEPAASHNTEEPAASHNTEVQSGQWSELHPPNPLPFTPFLRIAYGSVASTLADRLTFPSFFRTLPSDTFGAFALAHLTIHFGWNWIGILASDKDFGVLGAQKVKDVLHQRGFCVAFTETIYVKNTETKMLRIIELIRTTLVKVILIYSGQGPLYNLMEDFYLHNITQIIWLGPMGWSVSPVFSKHVMQTLLNGTITLYPHKGKIPGFKEFLYSIHPSLYPEDIFIKMFWEHVFGCSWPGSVPDQGTGKEVIACWDTEKLSEFKKPVYEEEDFRFTYSAYNAFYVLAYALHNLQSCNPPWGAFLNESCLTVNNFTPWQLTQYVRTVHFKNSGEEDIFFHENGEPPIVYDFLNWHELSDEPSKYVEIGMFDSRAPKGQELTIDETAIMWGKGYQQTPQSVCSHSCSPGYRKAIRRGQPICCYDCVLCSEGEISNQTDASSCVTCPSDQWSNANRDGCVHKTIEFLSFEEPLGIILTSVSTVFSALTLSVLCVFIKFRDTPLVKANNRDLSYVLLISLALCFLCSLTFLGHPRKVSCLLRQPAFGIIFSVCVSTILAKTVTVVIAFSATKPGSQTKKWVGTRIPNGLVICCCVVQLLLFAVWLCTSPPFPNINSSTAKQKLIFECNEGSTLAFYCMLGYLGLLALVCFIVAFLARKLPDSFNEAKFITFSMLVFISVWLSFIPAYLSTQGKYMVAVEIFAILSSSAGLLSCIFFPKFYIIVFRPEKNNREHLIGRLNIPAGTEKNPEAIQHTKSKLLKARTQRIDTEAVQHTKSKTVESTNAMSPHLRFHLGHFFRST
ncbi:vomeronasal type-2 receptor 26-like [Protopterus annectens]|uniref:vomeronasal type-2 receptor 26-like n=1 Tax=Protopterus annectens TaxID=7888 RepID=UPI001CFBDCF8|nr:vomeronasal type-2 receptor 26-like [Protopterus annectens]